MPAPPVTAGPRALDQANHMGDLAFLPNWPLSSNQMIWVGVLLVAGVAGGELVRRVLRLPRITGYAAAGLALGPGGWGLIDKPLLDELVVFADIALGLVLFELGTRLDLAWLRRSPGARADGRRRGARRGGARVRHAAADYFDHDPLVAAVAAAIAMSTSPAVLMRVAADLRAEGQVTERALILTAINGVLAFLALTVLIPWLHLRVPRRVADDAHPAALPARRARSCSRWWRRRLTLQLVRLVGKHAERQFIVGDRTGRAHRGRGGRAEALGAARAARNGRDGAQRRPRAPLHGGRLGQRRAALLPAALRDHRREPRPRRWSPPPARRGSRSCWCASRARRSACSRSRPFVGLKLRARGAGRARADADVGPRGRDGARDGRALSGGPRERRAGGVRRGRDPRARSGRSRPSSRSSRRARRRSRPMTPGIQVLRAAHPRRRARAAARQHARLQPDARRLRSARRGGEGASTRARSSRRSPRA